MAAPLYVPTWWLQSRLCHSRSIHDIEKRSSSMRRRCRRQQLQAHRAGRQLFAWLQPISRETFLSMRITTLGSNSARLDQPQIQLHTSDSVDVPAWHAQPRHFSQFSTMVCTLAQSQKLIVETCGQYIPRGTEVLLATVQKCLSLPLWPVGMHDCIEDMLDAIALSDALQRPLHVHEDRTSASSSSATDVSIGSLGTTNCADSEEPHQETIFVRLQQEDGDALDALGVVRGQNTRTGEITVELLLSHIILSLPSVRVESCEMARLQGIVRRPNLNSQLVLVDRYFLDTGRIGVLLRSGEYIKVLANRIFVAQENEDDDELEDWPDLSMMP